MADHVDIPSSSSTVSVAIIDTTRMTGMPWNLFFGPRIAGMDKWHCSGYSFLVTHLDGEGKQQRLLFDLSPAKDFKQTLPPPQIDLVEGWEANGTVISVTEHIYDVLAKEGIHLTAEDRLLWSHAHWDHMGKVSLFPNEIPLILGAGVRAAYGPGYPENQDSPWYTKDLEGRELIDVSFDDPLLFIGGFKAIDYFEDGSFYLLHAPGHSQGHLNGLARITENSFIFLGADSYHHGSELRPNATQTLPETVRLSGPMADKTAHNHDAYQAFTEASKPGSTPFLTIGWQDNGFTVAVEPAAAVQPIAKIQAFDMDDRVLCICSHDISLIGVIEVFPATANDWKSRGWKEKGRWKFIEDFAPYFESMPL